MVLIGGAGALVAKNLTFFTQQDLVDRDETVTLVVPTDWWDETSPRAGHADGTEVDVLIAPDVEASSSDERLDVAVWVDRRPESSHAQLAKITTQVLIATELTPGADRSVPGRSTPTWARLIGGQGPI